MSAQVLIVEDESLIAQHISKLLQTHGYHICAIASDGKTAIEKIIEFQPNLILLDIKIKGEMDGIEVAEHIQSLYDIAFLYLTAYADEETLERARLTSPIGYVLKPFRNEQLISSVKIALSTHNNLINKYTDKNPPISESVPASYRIQPILEYINQNLQHEINLETLASYINMHPSYFCRFFRQEVGASPYQYIIQQRIEKAKVLLKQTDLLIIDISEQCGFVTHSQFNRHFRRLEGVTPKEFKEKQVVTK